MTGSFMDEELMTRRQVAVLFRVTSAAVATWARRGRLPEVRNEAGRPRYRRGDVEALFRSGSAAGGARTGDVAGRRASP
jgi:predicted site-specific integrase-resolvase